MTEVIVEQAGYTGSVKKSFLRRQINQLTIFFGVSPIHIFQTNRSKIARDHCELTPQRMIIKIQMDNDTKITLKFVAF